MYQCFLCNIPTNQLIGTRKTWLDRKEVTGVPICGTCYRKEVAKQEIIREEERRRREVNEE